MVSFLKNNSDSIIKLFVNQIGMTIFGHLLSAATFSRQKLLLATGILTILFYMYLIYSTSWFCGAKDKIKIDGGRMSKMPFKGIFIGLFANSLNILLAVFAIVFHFLGEQFAMQWAVNSTAVAYDIAWLLNGMYTAVISPVKSFPLRFFVILACTIPGIAVSGLAYFAGTSNFRIISLLGFNKNSDNKHRS